MHYFRIVSAALAFIILGSQSAAPQVLSSASLQFSTREPLETTGSYLRNDSSIYFAGSDDASGHLTVQVLVNKVVLDAAEDANAEIAWMDGHGSALRAEDRLALLDLAEALGKAWANDIRLGRLPRHRDFLFRHVLYWAEAPVGLALQRREIQLESAARPLDPQNALKAILDLNSSAKAVSCQTFTSTCPVYRGNCESGWRLPCKQGSCPTGKTCFRCDNTRTYLSGCTYASVSGICHDADGSSGHCFECETLSVGCNKDKNCVGRCGPGCGPSSCPSTDGKDGEGTYTYDCAEHDRCCGLHGGCFSGTGATHCGDEYAEAYDDTIYGKCSCTGCFKP